MPVQKSKDSKISSLY